MNERNKNNPPLSTAKLERLARYQSLEAQGYQRPDSSVDVHVHSVRRRRIDIENTSVKAALDGLVRGGILEDDGPNQIRSVTFTQEQGQVEQTVIRIIGGFK